MERPIEGPEPYRAKLTSEEAGAYLRCKADLFEKLMAEHLPTVRPVYMGRYKVWEWMDVAVLNYVLGRGVTTAPEKKAGKNIPDPDDETMT